MSLPMSSKRSTQTTNTFVSGPRGGKDFPDDDLLLFTRGLNYTKHSFIKTKQTKKTIKNQLNPHGSLIATPGLAGFTFLDDSRFSEWLGNSSSVRLCCLFEPGTSSVLVSASTVESLCTDDSSGGEAAQDLRQTSSPSRAIKGYKIQHGFTVEEGGGHC